MHYTRHLELHVVATEEGVWCDACALSTAMRIRWSLADTETLQVCFTGVHIQCGLCETCWVEP